MQATYATEIVIYISTAIALKNERNLFPLLSIVYACTFSLLLLRNGHKLSNITHNYKRHISRPVWQSSMWRTQRSSRLFFFVILCIVAIAWIPSSLSCGFLSTASKCPASERRCKHQTVRRARVSSAVIACRRHESIVIPYPQHNVQFEFYGWCDDANNLASTVPILSSFWVYVNSAYTHANWTLIYLHWAPRWKYIGVDIHMDLNGFVELLII